MKNLYLIGFMGAGKSTIARALAKKCPSKRIEMDQLIEEQQGMAIIDIFAAHGENYFRDLETELLRSFSESTGYVVSCGGGSVLRDENAALMKENGCIVFLRATPETIYERVKDSTNRPFKREYECGIYPGTHGEAPAALRSGGGYLRGHGRQGCGEHQ